MSADRRDPGAAAAEKRAHLSAMFEHAPPHFSVEPERFALVTFNQALERRVREAYGVELCPGMTPDEILEPAMAARWRNLLARALREGSFVTDYVTPSGDMHMLLTFKRLELAGTVLGVSVLAVDVTERKRAELALAESEGRFRALIEDSPVAIGVSSRDLRIEYVNRTYARMFHTTPEALVGLPVIEQWAEEARPQLMELMGRMESEPEGVEFESLGLRADGSVFPVHGAVAVLRRAAVPMGVVFLNDISERRAVEAMLHETMTELQALKDRLQQDNLALRRQITVHTATTTLLGRSPAIARVIEQAKTVAPTDSAVLITGETGTGKELLARAIHAMSPRCARQMVTVNCAALPAGLIESELFGREKGAYTGAWTRQQGRFEAADGSTLLLDEVAELPPETQAKLLRVLQDGRFERLGSTHSIGVNVRVIAATNHDLIRMVEDGRFRADLFYRLRVFPIEMPPLRSRPEDVPLLVWDAVSFFGLKLGKTIDTIPAETMQRLQQHTWPGNVRELRNLVERSVILSSGRTLFVAFEPEDASSRPPVTLADADRRHILTTLERTGWRIGGKGGAAEELGVERSTLNSMMKRLGISRPKS
ncbi:MAG TPA: sigma 54-interacting transcriptional regulator [Vicinamibacteria bacterium]|nr:sigma 54-interacting transcriptional regulator [Vicinamibacteria bacterium]